MRCFDRIPVYIKKVGVPPPDPGFP